MCRPEDSSAAGDTPFQPWSRRILICAWAAGVPFLLGALWFLFQFAQTALAPDGNLRDALEQLMGAVFMLAMGAGGPVTLRYLLTSALTAIRERQVHPNEPWLWREEWAAGRIPYSNRERMVFAWTGAVLLSPTLFGLAALTAEHAATFGIRPAVLYAAAGGVTLWLVARALVETQRWRKFGVSCCTLIETPGVIGGWLRTRLSVPVALRPGDSVQLTLKLMQRARGSKGRPTGTPRTRWQIHRIVPYNAMQVEDGRITHVPAELYIPRDAGFAQNSPVSGANWWQLEARARLLGLDYTAEFKVPVFVTENSRDAAPPEAIEIFGAHVDTSTRFHAPPHVTVTPVHGGLEITGAQPPGAAKFLVYYAVLIAVLVGAFALFGGRNADWVNAVLGVLFTSPVVLILLVMMYGRSAVTLTPDYVAKTWSMFGFKRTKRVPIEDVREVWIQAIPRQYEGQIHRVDIKTNRSLSYNPEDPTPGASKVTWFIDPWGITVADGIENRMQAEWLKQLIDSYLFPGASGQAGIPDTGTSEAPRAQP